MTDGKILVGVVGAAQGIRGEMRIKSYTGVPAAIGDYGPLSTEDGRRAFEIVSLRPLKDDMLVARLAHVDDRDAAAALTGTRLYADRARLPPPGDDEVYQADLIGLVAEDEDGRVLGRVTAVENYGAGDLLAVAPDAGTRDTLLVPFTTVFVPVLDIAAGRLVVAAGALASEASDGGGAAKGS